MMNAIGGAMGDLAGAFMMNLISSKKKPSQTVLVAGNSDSIEQQKSRDAVKQQTQQVSGNDRKKADTSYAQAVLTQNAHSSAAHTYQRVADSTTASAQASGVSAAGISVKA